MKYIELISDPDVLRVLSSLAPESKFSGRPLTVVRDGLVLQWTNGLESDWWVGQQEGVYTRQDIRTIPDDIIMAAAASAGIWVDEIATAFISRVGELAEMEADRERNRQAWEAARDAARAEEMKAARARLEALRPQLLDKGLADAAMQEMERLASEHPRAVRMTRKGDLVDETGKVLARFSNLEGMRAWLYQHGFRPSIDDREHFFGGAQ